MANIFHITTRDAWEHALREGSYTAPSLDAEGFIHCSHAHQYGRVARARFRGQPNLVLLEIDPARVGPEIKHENTEGGTELFPHIYGPLNPDAVTRVHPFDPDAQVEKHLAFVYGTLRRGGVRAMPGLFPGAAFVGRGSVRGRLYDLGEHPGLLLDESGTEVVGEVYEVDEETLKRLDAIEATSYYWRERVEVTLEGRGAECWVYVYDPEAYPSSVLIESGDWIEYAKAK